MPHRFLAVAAVLLLLPGLEPLSAQAQGVGGGAGPLVRMFDPKTVETLKGELTAVSTVESGRTDLPGRMTLTLKTDKESLLVYLGPAWHVDRSGVKLTVGDQVEVKGSRVMMEGKPLIIAMHVKKGEQTLELRDDQGVPRWRGGPQ
ncbi:MAG: DNA-binding protein [Deltaproteobacteria bacterium]|nr:DNA-binding protein [Deltaproteobacteria bacterium]